ncbi:PI-stichotoxin-She2a-like [Drosophila madeirensis]|uniref:PI-stichotoxin-She2a-like n=1 Tax=Drosophila madeirensis TaxID=30013 RepID=A0AAU9F9R1_DROMD
MVKLILNIVFLSLLLYLSAADNPPNLANRLTICTQPSEYGNCNERQLRWYFHPEHNKCKPFYYSGCGGNSNIFYSQFECTAYCIRPDYEEI